MKTNDPNYCLYHRIIGYPNKNCNIFKDKIQALIKAGVIQIKAKEKRVIANIATFQMGSLEVPLGATHIPKGELRVSIMTLWLKKGLASFATEQQKVIGCI